MLTFRLAGIPVGIGPSFWLVAGLVGWSWTAGAPNRPALILVWVAIVFVSVLVHELGHALVARGFGAEVAIRFTAFGGLTSWRVPGAELSPGRRAAVAGAGSAVGVVLGLALLAVRAQGVVPETPLTRFVVDSLIWVNLGWGLLNWLPFRPLDGGHLLSSLLEAVAPRAGGRIADAIFLLTALAGLAVAIWLQLIFIALLTGWLALTEITRHTTPRPTVKAEPFGYDDEPRRPPG